MSDFIQQAVQRMPHNVPSSNWLDAFRERGRARWQQQQLPTRKTENWKYTHLRALESGGFFSSDIKDSEVAKPISQNLRACFAIANLTAEVMVFVNGQFSVELSNIDGLPSGVQLLRFADANADQAALIERFLGSVVDSEKHLFSDLNDSCLTDGVFLHIAANCQVGKPIHVVWLTTAQAKTFTVSPRLLVVAEPNSEATLLEHFVSDEAEQNSFTNGITEICLQANAKLRHYRLHLEQEHALHIGGVHVDLARSALFDSFHLGLGSTLKRVDVVVNHRGEGAHCQLNGVYLPRNNQHVDYHTCIEHRVPNCTTDEIFRGIIGDSARAVFNGRIHIHRDAQKTRAQLSNKNLLTSNKAEIDTKPELEIYADDVQCAHGATIAQLDEASMHYLRTRGVGYDEARVMLSFGFINELINGIQDLAIADYLRPQLSGLFTRDPKLMRHLA